MQKSQLLSELETAGFTEENKQKILKRISVYPEELTQVHTHDLQELLAEIAEVETQGARQLNKAADAIDAIIQKDEIEYEQGLQRAAADAEALLQEVQSAQA